MTFRHWLALTALCLLISGSAHAWDFSLSTSGNTIVVNVSGMDNSTSGQTCAGASADYPESGASCGIPGSSFKTLSLYCNRVGTHTVFVKVWDSTTGGQYETRTGTVTVTEPPPPTCPQFDLITPGTKVLTHKYGVTDTYPPGQTADGEFGLKIRVRTAPGGTQLHVKVVDPPDTAPYGAPHQKDDNADPDAGTVNGGKTATVTLPEHGTVDVTLRTTTQHAGDNYVVMVSGNPELASNPDFVCSVATQCVQSPVITAWKRVYVETDRMFRRGAYISSDIAPCPTGPCFIPLSNVRGIGRRDTLRLIHAPRTNVMGPQLFYSEDVRVVGIERNQGRVEVTPFQRAYFGPDTSPEGVVLPFLADAVGIVTGDDATDYYIPNADMIAPLFTGTFVEHVTLQDDPVPALPFEAQVVGDGAPGAETRELARRWFFNFGRPNHQHLIGGSVGFDDGLQGLTTARIGTNWSWTFVDTVAASSPRRGNGEWLFNGEVTAHEMAHQWQVNPDNNGHCSAFRWNSTTLYCTMHHDYGTAATPCQGTCPEFFDGQVGFHYQSSTDSEYTRIRQRAEPVPQQP